MKKQAGFTLIELIMVIVILGILSAIALPRFADLSGSAEQASIAGARGAVASASAIAHAQALASNTANIANQTITVEGGTAEVSFRYPEATAETATQFGIVKLAQLGTGDYSSVANSGGTAVMIVTNTYTDNGTAGLNTGDSCTVNSVPTTF